MSSVGELHELPETCTELAVEWKISNFSGLSDHLDASYKSPVFVFSDSSWQLVIYPNGEKEAESGGYIGLYIWRLDGELEKSISFDLGFKKWNNTKESLVLGKMDFKRDGWGIPKIFQRSEVKRRYYDFLPSDILTVACTLKCYEVWPVRASLFGRLLNVSRSFKEILNDEKRSDVVFKVDGQEIKAHRMILESRCKVFAAMFRHDTVENRAGVVTIDDTTADAFRNVLSYVYCGEVAGMSAENVIPTYVAAHKYDLEELKKLCVTVIEQSMSVDLVCDVIVVAEMCEDTALKLLAKNFFAENGTRITETDKWQRLSSENPSATIQFLLSIALEKSSETRRIDSSEAIPSKFRHVVLNAAD